jgi:hypothetical protein
MRSNRPGKPDRKHPEVARDAMEDIKDMTGNPTPLRNEVKYVGANRDRALGEADRTGRNFHEEDVQQEAPDEGSEASREHEAD